MHSVNESLNIILNHSVTVENEQIPLAEALYRVLSENIISTVDIPSYNQSAVDGYAINTSHFKPNIKWTVAGEIKAGDTDEVKNTNRSDVQSPVTFKIFTGALVPDNVDAVIMKEFARNENNQVMFDVSSVKFFQNIRRSGEELQKGEIVFRESTFIQPEHIAVLAGIGQQSVKVRKKLRVVIAVTGNELKSIDERIALKAGEKYESNGIMLQNLLKKYFYHSVPIVLLKDDKEEMYRYLKEATEIYDVIITTGGVSVGDYDFTKEIIQKLGFKILIDKVAQKPGKPFVFAIKGNKVIFGLPGNPRAVLSCFYVYVLRFILRCYKIDEKNFLREIELPIDTDIEIKDNKTRILFVNIEDNKIKVPEKQDSHMLISAANADGIILVEKSIKKGELIKTILLR